MTDEMRQLVDLVHQIATAGVAQARKLEELQKRIAQLESERVTHAVGQKYGAVDLRV